MKTLADPRETSEVLRRLHNVQPDATARWGRMSAHQMICHLADSFRMALDERQVTAARPRAIVKWIALYLPVRWPAGLPTSVELDQESHGTRPSDFASDVRQVESLLRRITDDQQIPVPRILSSARCRGRPGSAGPTFTPTTICDSSALKQPLLDAASILAVQVVP